MARLVRPYIPLSVRLEVAQRQLVERGVAHFMLRASSTAEKLETALGFLFQGAPSHLDHDPALVNRRRFTRKGKVYYDPPANDPRFLVYREGGKVGSGSEHDIKTRVRGEHGQLSDLALARKAKRSKKKRERAAAVPILKSRPYVRHLEFGKPAKRKWPSRPFPNRKDRPQWTKRHDG